jgi:1-acyl-sn-glycerol-3-phosphate acyltransferase
MRFVVAVLRPFAYWLCRLLFRIEFRGTENIPLEGPCIIAPNHVTYADPIWVSIPVRRPVRYMAWDRMFRIPVLGFMMRVFGAFPVRLEGGDVSAQREAVELLRQGQALVIFPEGGRSKDGALMPFKLGAFRLALSQGVPILPVTIAGAYEVWPVGQLLPHPGKLTVTYHPVIQVEALPDPSREELKAKARLLAKAAQDAVATSLPPSALGGESNTSARLEETKA